MKANVFVTVCLTLISCFFSFDAMGETGVIPLMQLHFATTDSEMALLKTFSSISGTTTLVLTLILGGYFDRRRLFLIAVSGWIVASMLSITLGADSFMVFVTFRSIATCAAVLFELLTPVILADMFEERQLGIMLMSLAAVGVLFGMATTIASSWIVTNGVPWRVALVVGPSLSIVPLLGLLFVQNAMGSSKQSEKGLRSMIHSIAELVSIKSFLIMTAVSSFLALNQRAVLFWMPSYYLSAWSLYPDVFLGLSYTTIITLNSFTSLFGTIIGLPSILWFAQSWRHGTGPFAGRDKYSRAYPIVVSIGAIVNVAMTILSILLVNKSYVACLVITFFVALGGAADGCLSMQMMMMVIPPASRTAAVAFSRLAPALAAIPSAQIIGLVSDALRGDSTLLYDRFRAYQLGMLCSASFLVAGALLLIANAYFFPKDVERAEAMESDEKNIDDEKTMLIGVTKLRSESLLDTMIRSRTATVLTDQ